MYRIDSDATASVVASSPSQVAPPAAASPPKAAEPVVADTKSHGRVPLIKFIGKRSFVKSNTAPQASKSPSSSTPQQQTPKPLKMGTGHDFLTYGAFYGRPIFSEMEMEAIDSGGASLFDPPAPKAKAGKGKN